MPRNGGVSPRQAPPEAHVVPPLVLCLLGSGSPVPFPLAPTSPRAIPLAHFPSAFPRAPPHGRRPTSPRSFASSRVGSPRRPSSGFSTSSGVSMPQPPQAQMSSTTEAALREARDFLAANDAAMENMARPSSSRSSRRSGAQPTRVKYEDAPQAMVMVGSNAIFPRGTVLDANKVKGDADSIASSDVEIGTWSSRLLQPCQGLR